MRQSGSDKYIVSPLNFPDEQITSASVAKKFGVKPTIRWSGAFAPAFAARSRTKFQIFGCSLGSSLTPKTVVLAFGKPLNKGLIVKNAPATAIAPNSAIQKY